MTKRQFCSACLRTVDEYDDVQVDERVFHYCFRPECRDDRAEFVAYLERRRTESAALAAARKRKGDR